jgi:thiamine transport system permease protein
LIAIATVLVALPLVAIVAAGFGQIHMSQRLAMAAFTSAGLGVTSGVIALALGFALARGSLLRGPLAQLAPVLAVGGLMVPPAVLATGWFIATTSLSGSVGQAFVMIAALNGLMALPFAFAILKPALANVSGDTAKLCSQLGISGLNRLRIIDFPMFKRPLTQAILMAGVVAIGDLTAVTLLGSQGLETLPSLIHAQMGNYRGDQAAGTALMLALLCFGLTAIAQRIGQLHD